MPYDNIQLYLTWENVMFYYVKNRIQSTKGMISMTIEKNLKGYVVGLWMIFISFLYSLILYKFFKIYEYLIYNQKIELC